MTAISEIKLSRRSLLTTLGGGLGAMALSACAEWFPIRQATPVAVAKPGEPQKLLPTEAPKVVEVTRVVERVVTATPEPAKPDPTAVFEQRVAEVMRRRQANPAGSASDDAVHDEARRRLGTPVAAAKPTAEAIPGCPPAEQLGPWAPSASGEGETFEFTNHRGMLHMSLRWPSGKNPKGEALPWGDAEVSVALKTRGKSYEAINGAGTGWDYPPECPEPEFDRQVAAYRGPDRPPYTNFHGGVGIEELLRLGVVRERVVRRGAAAAVTPAIAKPEAPRVAATGTPGAVTTETGACVSPKPETLARLGNHSIDAKDGDVIASLWWESNAVDGGKEVRVRLPKSDRPYEVVAGAGSVWKYAAGCGSEAVQKEMEAKAKEAGYRVVTVEELKQAGLLR